MTITALDLKGKFKTFFKNFEINEDELNILCHSSEFIRVANKTELIQFLQPLKSIYLIHYGSMKVSFPSIERDHIIAFLSRGDIFGVDNLFTGQIFSQYQLTALEDSAVIRLPIDVADKLWMNNSNFKNYLGLQLQARNNEIFLDKLLSTAPTGQRIAVLFQRALTSQNHANANRISVRLTRKDIAHRVGARVETVIRTLSDWQKNGVVQMSNGYIEVSNPEKLGEIAGEFHTDLFLKNC